MRFACQKSVVKLYEPVNCLKKTQLTGERQARSSLALALLTVLRPKLARSESRESSVHVGYREKKLTKVLMHLVDHFVEWIVHFDHRLSVRSLRVGTLIVPIIQPGVSTSPAVA